MEKRVWQPWGLFPVSPDAPTRCPVWDIKVVLQPDPRSWDVGIFLGKCPEVRAAEPALPLPWAGSREPISKMGFVKWRFVLCARLQKYLRGVSRSPRNSPWMTKSSLHCVRSKVWMGNRVVFWLQQMKWTPCEKNLQFQVENVEGGKNV